MELCLEKRICITKNIYFFVFLCSIFIYTHTNTPTLGSVFDSGRQVTSLKLVKQLGLLVKWLRNQNH